MRGALAIVIAVAILASRAPRTAAEADQPIYVVIVHPQRRDTALDKKLIADAFLKKRTRWGDDETMHPVDQSKKAGVRSKFSWAILDRSVQSVRSYWNQIVFSGRGVPPPELESDAAVVAYVANTPGAIGYVSSSADVKGVRVVKVK